MNGPTLEERFRLNDFLRFQSEFSCLELTCLRLEQRKWWIEFRESQSSAIPVLRDHLRRQKAELGHEVRMLRIDVDELIRRFTRFQKMWPPPSSEACLLQ